MANTYTLIASNTLSSSAASVTFSSIPSTYTDLVLRVSARLTVEDYINITLNESSSSIYSNTRMWGDGSTANSGRQSNTTNFFLYPAMNTNTANTFSSHEVYIPSYTVSQNKPISVFEVTETNATGGYQFQTAQAVLFRSTSAVTSLTLTAAAGSIVSGSSFWLYGVKNS